MSPFEEYTPEQLETIRSAKAASEKKKQEKQKSTPEPKPQGAATSTLTLTPYSKIPRTEVSWCWKRFVPFGMLTMLDGDPDVGKSTLTVDIAARVTTGAPMPDGTPGCDPGHVLILSAEDSAESTIGPRLLAAGANMEMVHRATFLLDGAEREPTICDTDIALIERQVREHGIKLVIIDPMTAYLDGNVRVYVDHDVRRALLPLKGLAERTDIALIVIRHWTKAQNPNALHRGGGSIGITAAARVVLAVAFDPDDDNADVNERKRVLAVAKSNVSAKPPSREFTLETVPALDVCRVRWGAESKHTANTLSGPVEDRTKVDDAAEFLEDALDAGPMTSDEVEKRARDEGIATATLRRAKQKLGISRDAGTVYNVPTSDGTTVWWMKLPDLGAQTSGNEHLPMTEGAIGEHQRGDAWEAPEGGSL